MKNIIKFEFSNQNPQAMSTEKQKEWNHTNVAQSYNKKQLANLLGVSVFILNKMIEAVKDQLGKPTGTMYSVNQVKFMAEKYGIRSGNNNKQSESDAN